MNETLKHAEIYYSEGIPYMKLIYEYIDHKGTHKVTIPRLDFPVELKRIPNIKTTDYGYEPYSFIRCIRLDSDMVLNACTVDTKEGPITNICYLDELIIPKTHDMTLEEIEKKLGYPVRIVSNKEKVTNEKHNKGESKS